MGSKSFWIDAGERAVRTFAQALLALFGAGVVDVVHAPWGADLAIAAGAAGLSVLTSIVASGVAGSATAGLVDPAPTVPAALASLKAQQTARAPRG